MGRYGIYFNNDDNSNIHLKDNNICGTSDRITMSQIFTKNGSNNLSVASNNRCDVTENYNDNEAISGCARSCGFTCPRVIPSNVNIKNDLFNAPSIYDISD